MLMSWIHFVLLPRRRNQNLLDGFPNLIGELDGSRCSKHWTIDEEHDTPSPVVLDAAADLACWMALSTFEPPMRVLITVDGGISFERRDGTNYSVFEVDESCSIEFKHYIDSSLCSKIQIDRRRLANQAHKLLDAKYTGI